MNIIIIAHSLYPISEPYAGGLEKITHLLVNHFVKRGHEVTLFAKKGSSTLGKLISYPSYEDFKEEYESFSDSLGYDQAELYQIYIYNWAMNYIHNLDADIIHNHSLHHIPIIRGIEFGKKFYTTFHTPIFPQLAFGLKLTNRNDNHYTSISKFQQLKFQEFTDSHVIYNGIEVDSWKYLYEKDNYFMWMGRICPEKAPHEAVEACVSKGQELIIAGPISNEQYYIDKLEPLLEYDKVTYVGHLNSSEINEYLMKAKAYMFTSIWDEPYGLTIAESLAAGTPVIAYDVGAIPEIITSKTGIIVQKSNITDLEVAIDDIKFLLSIDCRKRAEDFCNIKLRADEYLNLYQNESPLL